MEEDRSKLRYGINDFPPLIIAIAAALQHILLAVASCLSMSYIISDIVCAPLDHPIRPQLFSTSVFMCGLTTIVNSAIGIRLPIFQGPSASYIPPLLVMKTAGGWTCPPEGSQAVYNGTHNNMTDINVNGTLPELTAQYSRLRELQGSLILALAFEFSFGAFGMMGMLMRLIGPLTFSVTITLIGLSLYPVANRFCSAHWGLSIFGTVLLVIFSMYLNKVKIPIPSFRKNAKEKKTTSGFPLFLYFPVVLTILLTWSFCAILTETNVLSSDPKSSEFRARTDVKINILHQTPWFYVPYPGQFGLPSFSTAAFIGFLASVVASSLESVGDYHAASSVCKEKDPPNHAINRGIMIEGFMGMISGLFGSGHATTSYSGNISVIGLTEIASRRVLILAGFISILLAVVGKFGAVLTMVPDPALGAAVVITFGNLTALGIFSLKKVDFGSSRNLSVYGTSIYIAVVVPEWLKDNPEAINTGISQIDQILKVILGTPMFLGSVISIFLDQTVKGTLKERGMFDDTRTTTKSNRISTNIIYDLPGVNRFQKRFKFLRKIPFLQSYYSNVLDGNEEDQCDCFTENQ